MHIAALLVMEPVVPYTEAAILPLQDATSWHEPDRGRLGKATLLRDLDFRDPVNALHAGHDELDQTSQEISH